MWRPCTLNHEDLEHGKWFVKHKISVLDGSNGDDKKDPEEEGDGKTPSFTVLLHGSLKVEGMVALVHVG